MEDNNKKDLKKQDEEKKDSPVSQPDPETLHKTDPQENMKGPLSSLLNKERKSIEDKGEDYVDGEEGGAS
ncbi:hypothetical protein A4H97_32870 [Niastella yeongjuensis]|uniref:Uncharacterized protein n=1 Tax=Niastella yeongjuensis TaxID=354355 RepID=A0A1V9EG89_9BACT|nr:hypothetical protein [Niastella yeongjuensis]OQP45133.1 hypothetical protein A4H97_32870 [Niastella yeongjuensis]SEP48651.1 hypothetical protein SAMN05660816_06801 [Niastella yeongjuensis]